MGEEGARVAANRVDRLHDGDSFGAVGANGGDALPDAAPPPRPGPDSCSARRTAHRCTAAGERRRDEYRLGGRPEYRTPDDVEFMVMLISTKSPLISSGLTLACST